MHAYGGGFDEPVFAAQDAFRALMWAMAEPGQARDLPVAADPPHPLTPGLGTLALALLDHDTPFFLDVDAPDARAWLRFHTGAPEAEIGAAAFALITDASALPPLDAFVLGTGDEPERSATLLIAVESLRDGPRLCLAGPGIEATATIDPVGLPPDFAARLTANRRLFPRGVDLVLVADGRVAGLPRSCRVVEA